MTAALNAMTETSQAMANPTLEELSELYSAQHRECWLFHNLFELADHLLLCLLT